MNQKKKIKRRSYKSLYEQCKRWYAEFVWSSASADDKKDFDYKFMVHNWLLEQNGLNPIPYPSGNEILIRLVSKKMISTDFARRIMDISEEELTKMVEEKKEEFL